MASEKDLSTVRLELKYFLMGIYGEGMTYENPEGYSALTSFLDTYDQIRDFNESERGTLSVFWNSLKMAKEFNMDKVFKATADIMMEDAMKSLHDPRIQEMFAQIYANMASPYADTRNGALALPSSQDIKQYKAKEYHGSAAGIGLVLAKSWDSLPIETKRKVISVLYEAAKTQIIQVAQQNSAIMPVFQFVKEIVMKSQVLELAKEFAKKPKIASLIDKFKPLMENHGGTVVMGGLAAIVITVKCYKAIKQWWKGEIDPYRCAKECVDSIVEVSAGIAGGLYGSALLGIIGPFWGGLVGGIVAGVLAKQLINRLTMYIFKLGRTEAEDEAYKFLGVPCTASNEDVNRAYRLKALRFHPDKGGRAEDFHFLTHQMAIIKIARGDASPE